MTIYVLDDEPIALRGTIKIIKEVIPNAQVTGFDRARDLFSHFEETKEKPDVVLCDIEMPGVSGLDFAAKFKEVCPDVRIIFVTAYSQYALEAFRLHVHGYILKPITGERVKEEIEYALRDRPQEIFGKNYRTLREEKPSAERLQVQCFGYFEVFWKGEPLMFGRRQTKELLAYLIDRKGAACTSEEIATALWEDEDNMKNLKARIRILISDMRQTLTRIGQEDLLIRRSGQVAVRKEAFDCDYYRLLEGDKDAADAFRGEYMVQYSWAEMTAGQLTFAGL